MGYLSTRRLGGGAIIALVFVGLLASVALAWDSVCDDGEACVWKNGSFVVPRAGQATGDADYTNNNYPNTTDGMHDSVSSIKNKFGTKSVVWFWNVGHEGNSYCLPAGWESGDLNSHNDEYDSHLIAVGSTC